MKKTAKHIELYYADMYDIVFNEMRRAEVHKILAPGTIVTFGAIASYGRWDDCDSRYLIKREFRSNHKLFIEFKKIGGKPNAH